MTEEKYDLCDGCKSHIEQKVGLFLGYTVNCCAYGCRRSSQYCNSREVVRYLLDLLKEEKKKND